MTPGQPSSQFENQYLTIPREQAARWSDEELTVAGYALSHPFLGIVEFMDPMVTLRGQKEGKRYDIKDSQVVSDKTSGKEGDRAVTVQTVEVGPDV